jgi:DnaJ family protein A protein 2
MDLFYRKSITLKEALCGFAFEIPHLNGKVLSLNNRSNPTVIKPNYRKIVQGLGMIRENAYGNLIIEFDIEFPESLTGEQITGFETLL